MRMKLEILLLRIAAYILIGRNVNRCRWISRRDNNQLWYDGENVQNTIDRMKNKYNGEGKQMKKTIVAIAVCRYIESIKRGEIKND